VTQRGNRREKTFFEDGDYALYLDLLAEAAARSGVGMWSYCLMPNHVHLVAVPSDEDGLRRTYPNAHQRRRAGSTRYMRKKAGAGSGDRTRITSLEG
jgi:putative transposase